MTNKQWHPEDLRKVFPEIPASCSRILMDTAGSLKEENGMKKRCSPRVSPRLALALVLVAISLMGVALAEYYPQIAEVFGHHYGEDTQAWLEKGDIALPADSIQVEGITFTLNEVVYRNQGLYGLGTITPGEGIVLLCEDCELSDAYGYAVHYGDEAPEGTLSIQEKAAQDGSTIKQVKFNLEQIGVNGGAMLKPGVWGLGEYPQRDGSIQFLFEVSDGQAVSEGETYTLQMTAIVRDVSPEGVVDYDNPTRQEWSVEIKPKPYSEVIGTPAVTAEAAPTEAAPTEAPAATESPAGNTEAEMQLIVPDEYTANGTLPVYEAKARDFSEGLDYTWFNQSGVAEETLDPRHIGGMVDFNDGGHLDWSSYTFFYDTYDGTYEATSQRVDGTIVTKPLPKLTMVSEVNSIASWMVFGFPGTNEVYTLERTQLTNISLEEAKEKAETLMQQLGMTGYTCTTALDMSLERIREMGSLLNEQIDNGNLSTNNFRYDYNTATLADEGYHLRYHKFGTDGDIAGEFGASFYVTADGIKSINLRDAYEEGDIVRIPASLVDAETVAAALSAEIASSRYPEELKQINRATLTWMPVRSGKDDSMVMTPVWVLSYLTVESDQQGYECWAVFDAIDGTLRDAIFN